MTLTPEPCCSVSSNGTCETNHHEAAGLWLGCFDQPAKISHKVLRGPTLAVFEREVFPTSGEEESGVSAEFQLSYFLNDLSDSSTRKSPVTVCRLGLGKKSPCLPTHHRGRGLVALARTLLCDSRNFPFGRSLLSLPSSWHRLISIIFWRLLVPTRGEAFEASSGGSASDWEVPWGTVPIFVLIGWREKDLSTLDRISSSSRNTCFRKEPSS